MILLEAVQTPFGNEQDVRLTPWQVAPGLHLERSGPNDAQAMRFGEKAQDGGQEVREVLVPVGRRAHADDLAIHPLGTNVLIRPLQKGVVGHDRFGGVSEICGHASA